jgi:hypothetical protein
MIKIDASGSREVSINVYATISRRLPYKRVVYVYCPGNLKRQLIFVLSCVNELIWFEGTERHSIISNVLSAV